MKNSAHPSALAAILSLSCVALLLATTRAAHAESAEEAASEAAEKAMREDYPGNRLSAARRKLERALKKCGAHACSKEVRAELQRDLGVVLFGLGKKGPGRNAFKKALALDPNGRLDPELGSPPAQEAYRRAGGTVGKAKTEAAAEPDAEEAESDAETQTDDDTESEAKEQEEATSAGDGVSRIWFSLSVQQDLLWHGKTHPACGGPRYACFADGTQYSGPIWPEYGNQVRAGLGLATTRLLLGFDALVGTNLEVGTRLGIAFGGGPTPAGRNKFLPVHAELRGAYFFGSEPFARDGFRPYLALGAGIAEVRSHLTIDVYPDAEAYNQARQLKIDAWRTAGRGFISPALGSQFAFSRSTALSLELRVMALLGVNGVAPAGSIGFVQGL